MRIRYKITLIVLVLLTAGIVYAWPYVQMNFAESARYTENNRREYEFYTPELLKKMPRVTGDYEFGFSNVSGPGTLVYDLQFKGTSDANKINSYLEEHGYKKSSTCDIQGDCWKGEDPKVSVSVGIIKDPSTLIVSLVVDPSYEHEKR